jgi:GT2 family glycosyltransferase
VSIHESGIDVVVTNYRTPADLKKFVAAYLFQKSTVPTTLTVVDVDPSEDQYDEVKDYLANLDIELQYWPIMGYNCGYSGACNFAATVTNSEIVAFFNADTQLFDTTLQDCYDVLTSDPEYGIAGPLQVNSAGKVTHAGIFGTNDRPELRGWQSSSPSSFTDVRDDAVSVSGSAYFVKRTVWEELSSSPVYRKLYPHAEGAFLPTPHYYEETWCSYFARYLGYKVVYVGSTMMNHEWHKSSAVGDVEGRVMNVSRTMFREACDAFGIQHD